MKKKPFKIGDRVRCINADGNYLIVKGQIYTVDGFAHAGGEPTVTLQEISDKRCGFFYGRFELADSFDVSTATDQELADAYRKFLDERGSYRDELIKRGFDMYQKGQKIVHFTYGKDVTFRKSVTTTVEL